MLRYVKDGKRSAEDKSWTKSRIQLSSSPGKGKEDTVELTLGPGAAVQETPGANQWRLRLGLV